MYVLLRRIQSAPAACVQVETCSETPPSTMSMHPNSCTSLAEIVLYAQNLGTLFLGWSHRAFSPQETRTEEIGKHSVATFIFRNSGYGCWSSLTTRRLIPKTILRCG